MRVTREELLILEEIALLATLELARHGPPGFDGIRVLRTFLEDAHKIRVALPKAKTFEVHSLEEMKLRWGAAARA